MYVYKISNIETGKVYIGQTLHNINERFKRHKQDALSGRLDTHLARAIRKYGPEKFIIEEIDQATSQEELTLKEHYWINAYDSVRSGYNETDSITKCGGNTYLGKTPKELDAIKEKIRATKLGGNNPNARAIKCKNINTQEELHFLCMADAQKYFNEQSHNFITKRCRKETHYLYKGEWAIAYEDEPYDTEMTQYKGNARARGCRVTNLETNECKEFPSYAAAERYFGVANKAFSGKASTLGRIFIRQKKYQIEKLY